MVRMMKARKKVKPTFSKRSHSSIGLAPTTSFFAYNDFFRTEVDKKEASKVIKKYIKDNFDKKTQRTMLRAPEWCFTTYMFVAATISWKSENKEFPDSWNWKAVLDKFFNELKARGEEHFVEEDTPQAPKKSIQDIVKEKTSDFIAEVEYVLDEFFNLSGSNDHFDVDNYSVYNELQKIDAAYNTAKGVYDYYLPVMEEAKIIAGSKPPPDYAEAYDHWDHGRRQEYLKLLTNIVNDAERYMMSKKAVRKTKIKRPMTVEKQIKSLKYLKDSSEFKLTSIHPSKIIGSSTLYTFNTKTRVFTEYVSTSVTGFKVKGSSLVDVDLDKSRETKLRKPDEFLQVVLSSSPQKINAQWKLLTTKVNTPNARINKDTIILKSVG